MHKILISLLLASAAASPAIAGPRDHSDRDAARAERQQAHDGAKSERAERPAPPQAQQHPQFVGRPGGGGGPDRPQFVARPAGGGGPEHPQFDRPENGDRPDRPQFAGRPDARNSDGNRAARDAARQQRFDNRDQRVEQRQEMIQDRRERNQALRQSDRPLPGVMHTRVPVVSDVPRPGTQPPLRVDSSRRSNVQWNTNWRHDNRYDWHNWRDRHRSWFHLGFYYDPFGWGYNPFQIGWRMWPSYYGNSFWINDPWQYRLPYAPPGTRWVRYYDDAVLVDMWSGEVEDVIYNFFW
jgi:hypothetical protein